jgi:hypothetical protein
VTSVTPVQNPTNQGTTTSSTININLASAITPTTGDLVYAYTGYSNCGTTATPTYGSGYTGGTANIASGSYTDGSCGPASYRLNDGDEYVNSWGSGTTTAPFTVSQSSTPTTGSSGWVEITVEFDPPVSASPAASHVSLNSAKVGLTVPLVAGPLGIASLLAPFVQLPSNSNETPQSVASNSAAVTYAPAMTRGGLVP